MKKVAGSLFIDSLCALSGIGIWPRFIEPRLLLTTHLTWKLPTVHSHLDGLKIVQFSDLHFNSTVSSGRLKQISETIRSLHPDILLFTGDFICYSQMESSERLGHFLSELSATLGCFCIFGNHDYASYVSRTSLGNYDILEPINPVAGFVKGIRTLFQRQIRSGQISNRVKSISLHEELCQTLQKTSFQILENKTTTLPIGLNIVGLGDYSLGRFLPHLAFQNYEKDYPGIVLSHNPDTLSKLTIYPGNWVFCGHTHGEQIHLPFPSTLRNVSRKLTRLEDIRYTRGLYHIGEKTIYVNRGIGCHKPLRFCSPPEILFVTLKKE